LRLCNRGGGGGPVKERKSINLIPKEGSKREVVFEKASQKIGSAEEKYCHRKGNDFRRKRHDICVPADGGAKSEEELKKHYAEGLRGCAAV